MPAPLNRQIVLKARPAGGVTADLFELVESPRPVPGPGEVLIRVRYLSIDPAMRGWISAAANYSAPVPIGAPMRSFTLGEVAESNHPNYAPGDLVYGRQGWQDWAVSDGADIDRKVDPADGPVTAALHVLGLNGITAYFGLLEVGKPKQGETVVVSTAAGAVGSIVGQIAKIRGCRAVGITGSAAKVRQCLDEFGYHAALDYRAEADLSAALSAACPDRIDVYFDNTGGPISDAVLEHLNPGARIVICGTMGIPDVGPGEPPPVGPRPNRALLVARARMQGFLVLDHMPRAGEAVAKLSHWLREGRLRFAEDIVDGLEAAPAALLRVLAGANTGKMLVRVDDTPAGPAPPRAVSRK
ncbi:MAG: NADP-dependent oxidoreductase [Rhodospirillales bacterium]|nr:MAG: NADP-dependent oxidoreductase [Rhodospirillales bacterium]